MENSIFEPGLSVVVMAFNEAESLEMVVREIGSTLEQLKINYEIIIIDDGSSDSTGIITDRLTKEFSNLNVIHHRINLGLGNVYREGFENAQYDFITFYPADGQFPASNINRFIPLMDNFDLMLGDIQDKKFPPYARFLSGTERFFLRLLFGNLPRFEGVFMVRRKILQDLELKSQGRAWMIVMELIIRASRGNYRIGSVPIQMFPREKGKSKVNNPMTIISFLIQMINLRVNL